MGAPVDTRDTRAVDLLLEHCAALSRVESPEPRNPPVFDRLHELLGAELTRRLLFALSGRQRARSGRRPG